jgi:hypothetical protein
MSRAAQLAKHVERTVVGPMWHGPALSQLLDGVTHDRAAARPIPGAHTIWEIVLHVSAWADITRARLNGQSNGAPTPEEDWPPAPVSGSDPNCVSDPAGSDPASDWRSAIARLDASHRALAADIRELGDQRLDAMAPGLECSVTVVLQGVVEHGTYHGGQIALLKKAL